MGDKRMLNPQNSDTRVPGGETAVQKEKRFNPQTARAPKRGWPLPLRNNPIRLLGNTNKVQLTDLCIFTTHLATMTTAGLPVIRSIEIAVDKTSSRLLASVARQICDDMKNGDPLSTSIRRHPKIFNNLYCTLIATGEKAGCLKDSLYTLAQLLEKIAQLNRRLKNVLLFSSCSILFSLCMSVIIVLSVPRSAGLLQAITASLSGPGLTVMALSGFLSANPLPLLTAGGLVALFLYVSVTTRKGLYLWDAILLKIPVLGELKKKSSAYLFLKTYASLMNSGINNKKCCAISAECSGNRVFQKAIDTCIKQKSNTNSFTKLIRTTGMFPPIVITMISLAEIKGTISTALNKITKFYEEEANAVLDAFTSVIEPFVVLLLGIVIGSILLAIYLPHYL